MIYALKQIEELNSSVLNMKAIREGRCRIIVKVHYSLARKLE